MTPTSVGIAMSGGVDSTVSALLLKEQGFRVHGFFMLLPLPDLERLVERVRAAADRLDIPLHLIDLRDGFTREVIDYFTDGYRRGTTPNPCIRCNAVVKFGLLRREIERHGLQCMATGHYARLDPGGPGGAGPVLRRGRDPVKDQSYFLCRLGREELERILLPLGDWTKDEVRRRAARAGLGPAAAESQDVCFLQDRLERFLGRCGLPPEPGDIVDRAGTLLGRHNGLWKYTIGQRRGLGIPDASPWYVLALDSLTNRLIVGKEPELHTDQVCLESIQWQQAEPPLPWRGLVQLRSRHRAAAATAVEDEHGLRLHFLQRQRAVTPGQYAALYEEDRLIGSGVIASPREAGQ